MPDRKAREAERLIQDMGIFVTCWDPSIGRDDLDVPPAVGQGAPAPERGHSRPPRARRGANEQHFTSPTDFVFKMWQHWNLISRLIGREFSARYRGSSVPEPYRAWLYLNPLTFTIEQARGVSLFGLPPDWTGIGLYSAGAVAILAAGLFWFWFQRTRNGFADVM